jgi:L-ribulose-5-phosphate 3-epimerase
MIRCGPWLVGLCSWSLKKDIGGVIETFKKLGIDHVHLALRPEIEKPGGGYLEAVQKHSWTISSTMIDFPQEDYTTLETIRQTGGITPDEWWPRNRDWFIQAAKLTKQLRSPYLAMHAGFIDHTDAAYIRKFHDRIRCLADAAGENNITLLMETGQETAQELKQFLEEMNHPALGVNFDPANMILYAKGDPIQAIRALASWVKHLHAKDAIRTQKPGTWGTEVPWGDGEVKVDLFLRTLKEVGFNGVLAIEREMGEDPVTDIKLAAERMSRFKG